jgi:adenylosuccinate synthase
MTHLADYPGAQPELETLRDEQLSLVVAEFYGKVAGYATIVPGDRLGELMTQAGHTIFEGAQGVLLDEWYGFFPYVTRSTTTAANAVTLLDEQGFDGSRHSLGLLRAYATRHGAGPFVTEDPTLTAALTEPHNSNNPWQQGWRAGYFDAVALRYALEVAGHIDSLVVTNLDRLVGQTDWRVATAYQASGGRPLSRLVPAAGHDLDYQRALTAQLLEYQPAYETARSGSFQPGHFTPYLRQIEAWLGRPVSLASAGLQAKHKWPVR